VVLAAYVLDRIGLAFTPARMLPIAVLCAAAAWSSACRREDDDRSALVAWAAISGGTFAWLMWIARPSFFPLGTGPDLTHHLLLTGYIDRHWRLVHDPSVEQYLGEMTYYTPGSHVLTSLAGAWLGTNSLHALHAVLALTTALGAGFTFLIGYRLLALDLPRAPLAAVGALSLFAAQRFFLGPFLEYSFVAQVVSQGFVMAMWWAITAWDQEPRPMLAVIAGVCGGAAFLTWPVLIGPPLLALGLMALTSRGAPRFQRIAQAILGAAIVLAVAASYFIGRGNWLQLAGTGGQTALPTVASYGSVLLVLSSVGVAIAAVNRRARPLLLFALALALQAAALYVVATRAGNSPYMALKMLYLAIFVQGVGVTVSVGTLWLLAGKVFTRLSARWSYRLAVGGAVVTLILVGRPLVGAPRSLSLLHAPATSLPLEQAGDWARGHVPPQCVEYLVPDDETAYWLHLAVLGNPRISARTGDNSTYELPASLVRWLTPGGLPYAIVDLPNVPRDIRDELDIVARFDTAAVARRRGPSSCPTR
jgi:hypothetical protein